MTCDIQNGFHKLQFKLAHWLVRVENENDCVGMWNKSLGDLSMGCIERAKPWCIQNTYTGKEETERRRAETQ